MKKACSKEGWDLSPEQNSRWDYAIKEYIRITDEVIEKQWALLTPEYREGLEGKEAIRWLCGINPPGHQKSALFRRLLDGKAALPFIPPKRYSYPWYALFDRPDETHEVINAVPFLNEWLLIDQGRWSVLWANQPATEIAGWSAIDWSGGEMLATDQDITNEKPVFLIKCGGAPLCRLTTGRTIRRMRRAALERSPEGKPMDISLSNPLIKEIKSTRDCGSRMDLIEVEIDTWTLQVVE
ncbi:MAG: hypothetical protein PHT38_02420 [Halothiobacillus sp.]|nr:hypothetical protein [Halothiobacillus sp.]